jgi:hypothetical protein
MIGGGGANWGRSEVVRFHPVQLGGDAIKHSLVRPASGCNDFAAAIPFSTAAAAVTVPWRPPVGKGFVRGER